MASDTWSDTLSGCPSETDSDVNSVYELTGFPLVSFRGELYKDIFICQCERQGLPHKIVDTPSDVLINKLSAGRCAKMPLQTTPVILLITDSSSSGSVMVSP